MKLRELVTKLISSTGDIDDEVKIRIVKRNEDKVVTHVAVVPISYINYSEDQIAIEESQIEWQTLSDYERRK